MTVEMKCSKPASRIKQDLHIVFPHISFLATVLIFGIIFDQKAINIIETIFIAPLFSSVVHSSLTKDSFIILLAVGVIRIYWAKAKRGVNLSMIFNTYIFAFSLFYLIYRCSDNSPFYYTRFTISYISKLALLDVLLAPFLGISLYWIMRCVKQVQFKWKRKRRALSINSSESSLDGANFKIENSSEEKKIQGTNKYIGIQIDAPLDFANEIDKKQDKLAFLIRSKQLFQSIHNTPLNNEAIAISLLGAWGAGKTTFMSALSQQFSTDSNFIQVKFNPWKAENNRGIISMFFSILASSLSKYDDSLKTRLLIYGRSLLENLKGDKFFEILKSVQVLLFGDLTQEQQFQKINSIIKKIGKRIVIYIDDVDRLDKDEVKEVLKLVRNTSNFANTIFIVAFDQAYVEQYTRRIFSKEGKYLEKIFNYEVEIPKPTTKDFFKQELYNSFRNASDDDFEFICNDRYDGTGVISALRIIEIFIKSYRDIKRLQNLFFINYATVEGNVYLPDFLSICILKLKMREIVNLLYNEQHKIFKTKDQYDAEKGDLLLRYQNGKSNEIHNTVIFELLSQNKENYNLNGLSFDEIVLAIKLLFPENRIENTPSKMQKSHLRICQRECFDRYFIFDLQGHLDENDIYSLLEKPKPEIESEFKALNDNKVYSDDIKRVLENFSEFKDKIEFEKIIEVIIFYSEMEADSSIGRKNYFSVVNFAIKLDWKHTSYLKVFYPTNEDYIDFVTSLYKPQKTNNQWGFFQQFLMDAYKNFTYYSIEMELGLPKSKIEQIFISALHQMVKERTDFLYNILEIYVRAIPEDPILISEWEMLKKDVRLFINQEKIYFLNFMIYKTDNPVKYRLKDFVGVFFEAEEDFVNIFAHNTGAPFQEFKEFYDRFKKNNLPLIEFDFRYLTP